jgi:putative glycosyltransferase (TIGR04372 family)
VSRRRFSLLGRYRDPVWRTIVAAVSLVEVPRFLLRNRGLFRNRLLLPFTQYSFGHTVSGIDYASRLYWPHRISLLYLPHPDVNPLVPRLFAHNVDVFTLESSLRFRSVNIDAPRYAMLRFFTLLTAAARLRHFVIDRVQVYSTLALAQETLLVGKPDEGRTEPTIDYTGYVRLLNDGVGRDARLPPELLGEARRGISARHPAFFERPFVALTLRSKGRGLELHTALRDAGPAENYAPAVRWLAENGYHVVPWGEAADAFRDIPGVYPLDDVDLDPRVLNLFVFTACAFFVGQQSGAPVLAGSAGVPCVIVDAFPYSHGTFRRGDVILFKGLRERDSGRELSLVETYRDHPDLALGYNLDQKRVNVVPNTPEEILDAVQEGAAAVEGRLAPTEEDELLAELFRRLPAPHMHLAYHRNRPTLSVLRRLKDELLATADADPVPEEARSR